MTVTLDGVLQSPAASAKVTTYNGVATAGNGLAAVSASARSVGAVAAVASVAAITVGAADASFLVCANVNVTASVTHTFTVTIAYTDEGNTGRTLVVTFTQVAGGTTLTAITNVTGVGPYEGIAQLIRCKAGTTITVATAAGGTYTSVTYNVEGLIVQVA